jgi:hypothetical protein
VSRANRIDHEQCDYFVRYTKKELDSSFRWNDERREAAFAGMTSGHTIPTQPSP